jgi:hypothetical protein
MPAVIRAAAAFPYAKGLRLRWLPLVAALIAGAALSWDLAPRNLARTAPAAPAERHAAPPAPHSAPLNQTPYIPPIRIGSSEAPPVPGASAPLRDSAALWRDGESS